jgi:hypothetical protein
MIEYDVNIWRGYVADAPKLFVYTMGKVGSSSVSDALYNADIPCLDIHALDPKRIQLLLGIHLESGDFERLPPHIIRSLQAYNSMIYNERVKIISLIREPVSRNISAVFQNLPKSLAGRPDEIMRRLKGYNTKAPDYWFLNDFGLATGIDVFEEEISPSDGYFEFTGEKCDVLVIKLETDDSKIQSLISDFVGQEITLERSNVGGNKWYQEFYSSVRNNPGSLSDSYLEQCFDLKYYSKFYSEDERQALANKLGFLLKNS